MRSFRRMNPPEHAHPFVKHLYEEMNAQRANPRDVEERAGLGCETINQWRTRRCPRMEELRAALNVLGLEMGIFRMTEDGRTNSRVV